MKYSSQYFAQLITQICKAYQIKDIVISPGSRNAPLILGFSHDDYFNCYSIVDERCAGFFALGISQNTSRPTVLVCTSGSALLNYYPAVAEAYYSDLPLVVISADRPPHMIDIGDGQTIRQKTVFTSHILHEVNISPAMTDVESKIKNAFKTAFLESGPTHINVPFEEPLYELTADTKVSIKKEKIEPPQSDIYKPDFEDFLDKWRHSPKKMILIGQLPPKSIESKTLSKLIEQDDIIIFTETLSNTHHPKYYCCIDKIISTIEGNKMLQKHLQPNVLLTFGGMIVSKKIKKYLRDFSPKYHFHVDLKKAYDTYFSLTHHFKACPNSFLSKMSESKSTALKTDYATYWDRYRQKIEQRHQSYISKLGYSDLWVFYFILSKIPSSHSLQISNSSAVRYVQLFDSLHRGNHFCNRGTSGIEGSMSTAVGASLHQPKTTFLTGDLSFFYDSNALWNNYIKADFRIILINNGGGGIFRIINEQAEIDKKFEYFVETKHNLSARLLAEHYGFGYSYADDISSLESSFEDFYKQGNVPRILEVFTKNLMNEKVLKSYFEYLKG